MQIAQPTNAKFKARCPNMAGSISSALYLSDYNYKQKKTEDTFFKSESMKLVLLCYVSRC
jgi:hypothetical protein